MMGIGPGGLISDFELFKNPDHEARNRMVVEAVDMIQRIWSQDPPYDLKGEFWNVSLKDGINRALGIGIMPKPYQQPHPPISISLASPFSSSAKTAAQKGWGIISANIIPTYSVASHWKVYSDACRAAGIAPRGENWRVARNMMVARLRPGGARPRVRRRRVERLFLHLHARGAEQRRHADPAQAARRHAGRAGHGEGDHRGVRDPRLAARPCSTSWWRSATRSARSARC